MSRAWSNSVTYPSSRSAVKVDLREVAELHLYPALFEGRDLPVAGEYLHAAVAQYCCEALAQRSEAGDLAAHLQAKYRLVWAYLAKTNRDAGDVPVERVGQIVDLRDDGVTLSTGREAARRVQVRLAVQLG